VVGQAFHLRFWFGFFFFLSEHLFFSLFVCDLPCVPSLFLLRPRSATPIVRQVSPISRFPRLATFSVPSSPTSSTSDLVFQGGAMFVLRHSRFFASSQLFFLSRLPPSPPLRRIASHYPRLGTRRSDYPVPFFFQARFYWRYFCVGLVFYVRLKEHRSRFFCQRRALTCKSRHESSFLASASFPPVPPVGFPRECRYRFVSLRCEGGSPLGSGFISLFCSLMTFHSPGFLCWLFLG